MKVFGLSLTLPNPEFRKKVTYIHDIQHVFHAKDTSWRGEGFIAGWEIATGMWKHFPIGILSLWAMGYSLWFYPKEVFNGYKKGLNNIGIIDLQFPKSKLMKLQIDELVKLITKSEIKKMTMSHWMLFLFWCVLSQLLFMGPFLLLCGIIWIKI